MTDIDLEYSPTITPISQPTRDTHEAMSDSQIHSDAAAALAAVLETVLPDQSTRVGGPYADATAPLISITFDRPAYAAAILAALDAAGFAVVPKTNVAAMMCDLSDRASEIARLVRERDLAVAHDRQPYPTVDAYERVCRVRDKQQAEIVRLRKIEEAARALEVVEEDDESDLDVILFTLRGAGVLGTPMARILALRAALAGGSDASPE